MKRKIRILIVDDHRKLGFHSWHLVPRTAICDPELTLGLPPQLTAATGMDAIAHCMETFMSSAFNPPADGIALDGLARGWANIERATREGSDRDARLNMMSASMQGAMAFQKGLGCVHSLSHSLGGINPRLHHGTLNAMFLPAVIAFNASADSTAKENRLARMAQAMGLTPGSDPAKTLAAARAFAATRSLEDLATLAAGDAAMLARLEEWNHLLGTLKSMGFGECIVMDLTIVRGLAYYTGFVFEAFETGGEARALAGGGRYDALVKKLGGPDLPAVGFGMGDVTLRDLLEAKKLIPAYADGPDFFVMVLGPDARNAALEDVANLRRAGFRVEYNLRDGKFGKLAQQAETAGAKYALVYGGEEVAKGVTKVRSLTDRTEAEIPRTDLVPALRAVLEEGMRAILP